MKKNILLISFCLLLTICSTLKAQSLPAGTCGIVYTYDAAGNRTKIEFVLNNTSTGTLVAAVKDSQSVAQKAAVQDVIKVDALFPNPTSGRITVRLVKPLQNASVRLMDMGGRVLLNNTENGSVLNYDLSKFPAGVYIIYINQGDQQITMKIIKR